MPFLPADIPPKPPVLERPAKGLWVPRRPGLIRARGRDLDILGRNDALDARVLDAQKHGQRGGVLPRVRDIDADAAMLHLTPLAAFASGAPEGGTPDPNQELLLHPNGVDGNASFTDFSDNGHTVTANGGIVKDDAQTPGANWDVSIFVDAAGHNLTAGNHSAHNIESSEFALEFLVRHSSVTSTDLVVSKGDRSGSYNGWHVFRNPDGTIDLRANGNVVRSTSSSTQSANTWYWVAFTRESSTIYNYWEGAQEDSDSYSTSITATSNTLMVGPSSPFFTADCWIAEVRLVVGGVANLLNANAPFDVITDKYFPQS